MMGLPKPAKTGSGHLLASVRRAGACRAELYISRAGSFPGGTLRRTRFTALLLVTALVVGCTSTTGPTGPANPNLIGAWLDSTDLGQVNLLDITGTGHSVTVVSPEYFLHSSWNGVTWWQPEGSAATALGTVTRDSVALCDPGYGGPCPNEIAYLRNGVLVLYLLLNGSLSDSAHGGLTYVHQTFDAADTIAPADAPPPLQFSGVWLSDSMPSSCSGIAQLGFDVPAPINLPSEPWLLQLYGPFYYANQFHRSCASSTWSPDSTYFTSPLPYPCTPANNCIVFLLDTVLSATDTWFLGVATDDSLADDTQLTSQSGWTPPYFLRDSGATSLARVRGRGSPPRVLQTRAALVRTQKRMAARWKQRHTVMP